MPGAFLSEPTSHPYGSSENEPLESWERVELSSTRRNRRFRRWAREKFLYRLSPEANAGWSDDSGYDTWSLSSSSGSEGVLFEHPTHGKPGLRICDTDDFITVQNPNPHTGEMSPSVLSLVSERTEPPHGPTEDLDTTLNRQKSQQKERFLRWRIFAKELPPTPPEHDSPPARPPRPTVEDEEPPDALDSSTQPLQSQPTPDHYAAFDPDHLRMPGALTITPPIKTVTSGGTDAISTWVAEESRRVFELPAGPLTPGESPLARGQAPGGPRIMRSQSKSQIQVPTLTRARSYSSYDARDAFCAQSRERVLGPRHPWERPAKAAVPRRVCSIPRKPVAGEYVASPSSAPHGPDDIAGPSSARSPITADYPSPPLPPPHRYEAGRPHHHGEWNASSRPPLDTPPASSFEAHPVPLTAPILVNAPPPGPAPDTHNRGTQTRASVAGAYKRHPIQPSFETPSVRAQTRLNGTGVQRLVITTGKPRQADSHRVPTATAGTQTATPSSTADKAQQTRISIQRPPPPHTADASAEKMKKPASTVRALSPAKPPKVAIAKSARKKLTKSAPTSKATSAKPSSGEKSVPKAASTAASASASTPAPASRPSSTRAPSATHAAAARPAANIKTTTTTTSSKAPTVVTTAAAPMDDATFAAQRAAALAALREQHAHHCSVGKQALAATAQSVAAAPTVAQTEEPVEMAQAENQPLIDVRVSKSAVVTLVQALAFVWAIVAGWYMLSVLGKGLLVVLWPVRWIFKGIAMLGGCVRGGGWGG
ncbi:hypothetical protein BFW01_g7931 [Lasiodiplodia theobromae]|nr:hypothetical protein BFW01_g7931 [Lasiodiplodia theobromae]